ncbi:MAG: PSD1 domain-containing protein [Planctomyces sp.]|nr:PSD1 domain-containing protein [Planctomyces sp.]
MHRWYTVLHFILIATIADVAHSNAANADDFFEQKIRPLLLKHCIECHGTSDAQSGLRLDSRDGWMRGGERGPAIQPGNPGASLLIRAVEYLDPDLQMPPEEHGGKLSETERSDLHEWIQRGAEDPRREDQPSHRSQSSDGSNHWAFQPVQRPEVPTGIHPIDALVERVLANKSFKPLQRANSATLARRLTIDLTGLLPTEHQIQLAESDLNALIEELLASPRYGERWARHWLDVARYSDTKDGVLMYGDGRMRPFAYTYRDYVIRAFNEDKPYDQFVREQLAADQFGLSGDAPELAALGFLTLGRMFDNNRHDVIDDQIDVVTRGLIGLTVSCSRCHDHKFDPVPTADYYSLYGVFASSAVPYDRPRIEAVKPEGEAFETELAAKLQALRSMETEQYELQLNEASRRIGDYLNRVATTEPDVSETAVFFLSLLPEDLRPQIVNRWRRLITSRANSEDPIFAPWFDLVIQERFSELKELIPAWRSRGIDERVVRAIEQTRPVDAASAATAYGTAMAEAAAASDVSSDDPLVSLVRGPRSPAWFPPGQIWYYLSRHEKDRYGGMVNELDTHATQNPSAAGRAMVMMDSSELYEPVVFRRGDPTQPGESVPRRFLAIIAGNNRKPFETGSGRLDLANQIVSPSNPLTARVMVNRIWMHHFGEPLVDQPSDFGVRTAQPLHAELLDFLADEFIRNGWKLKPLHRLILSSQTWQRTSMIPETPEYARQQSEDPGNQYLWRAQRRRLDMESMRDNMLQVSERLDSTMFGRPRPLDDPTNFRRTIYAIVERQSVPSLVRNFDVATADLSVARRVQTTVPQQALFAMNSPFMIETANSVCQKLTENSLAEKIQALYEKILLRSPSSDEVTFAQEYIASESLESFAQALLMTNEFLFVD